MAMRRRYPFGWTIRDFEEMMNDMESRLWGPGSRMLPAGGFTDRMLPAIRGEFRVDVRDHDDEVIVVADLPGIEREDISLSLLSPDTLEITSERKAEKEESEEGFYVRERMYGNMSRTVALPHDVTEKGTTATFKNGVLEIRLKKSPEERGKKIEIE